ncbi:WD40-repeat-containing domain protein [Syncephalis pseudoplumigaleata]|uniref:WD40-repeat-containing domain protein n=1 Tax=Syncephalis pseudoplumigaleata TaxID=1712513 RepID=A0A4P9YU17_9FUNG|nr:WD40-repeat-containing domain protein [Syncephalis pseudoplumigaleata]|eukprot:RKP22340.1 WD40-repeat-containing domain protein [Syncephalis pseudoplumigaleata]
MHTIAIAKLPGHIDYSFACAWHPNGRVIATGNQDKTTRLYDTRKLSESFTTLSGQIGSIRSLRFSDDGAFLAMAESADFVHLVETRTWDRAQEIDLFSEIAGIAFTPGDSHNLYVACSDIAIG